MKIGVLGGQFNPPHLGHLIMAYQILEFTSIDEIWLAPCYKHTFDKKMADVKHRITMTKMFCKAEFLCKRKIKYCDSEIKNKLSGDTIDLMDLLTKKHPRHEFSFIIGSDNLAFFKKWGRWEKLIKKYVFWVVPRPNWNCNLKKYRLDNNDYKFKVLKHPLLITTNISSTIIRNRFKKSLSITHLVSQNIKKHIIKHKLYK